MGLLEFGKHLLQRVQIVGDRAGSRSYATAALNGKGDGNKVFGVDIESDE